MSNSPDDPRLIPGHPEFVQRPATWRKTVAKQICEIQMLKDENAKLRKLLFNAEAEGWRVMSGPLLSAISAATGSESPHKTKTS